MAVHLPARRSDTRFALFAHPTLTESRAYLSTRMPSTYHFLLTTDEDIVEA